MTKLEAVTKQFEDVLNRFKEVLVVPKTDIIRDSAIQRFEFTLDLAWKAVKAFLEEKKGIRCTSPKDCFREAYRQGIIEYSDEWIRFVDMRNETVHTYRQEIADRIYGELPKVLEHVNKLLLALRKK